MKIHQLPMSARFEYEGQEYIKTGPLLATGPGGQRLIPKYAVLKVMGGATLNPERKMNTLSKDAVRDSFEAFYAHCVTLVPTDRQAELHVARDEFLKALD